SAAALRAYRDALRLAPAHFYIRYNMGLLYLKLRDRREAEASFRAALELAPQAPEIHTAFGFLRAEERRPGEAEKFYRRAIELDPQFLPARHNLALLLSGMPERRSEAISLWSDIVHQKSPYLPAWMGLAEALQAERRVDDAIASYREL